ncbi:hypothetical protein [Actinosynnema mirum]|uniref:hypothetical protein n=1 Tax=Actinosynnema mirum TaxID=40567 RepID=UPI00019AC2D4|nr:hypothetical protein [Actinosynnema mirum]
MTGGQVQLRVEAVAAARRLGAVGEDFGERIAALTSAPAAEGACWGGDESGQQFAKTYEPNVGKAQDVMRKAAGAMASIADGLTEQAESMRWLDDEIRARTGRADD